MTTTGPLDGFRIIDLTTSMSGPLATMILAEQGATVIKIEPPGGDVIRRVGPGRGGMSGFFANLNRGKRSIGLDLAGDAGRAVLLRLVAGADCLVHNLRGGTAETLGVDAATLTTAQPALVHVAISGFAPNGSRATDPVYDHLIQAASGIAARQADGGPPRLVRHGVVDKITAYTTAQAITAALLRRTRTGRGETVTVSMFDAAVAFLWPDGMANFTCQDEVSTYGDVANSFRLAATTDGHIAVNVMTDRQFRGLADAMGFELDARFATVEGRGRHGGEVMRAFRSRLASMTTADAETLLRRHRVPVASVTRLEDLASSEAAVESGIVAAVEHPVLGRLHQARPPARLAGTENLGRPAPTLGQDTDAVLSEAGFESVDIARLRAAGTVV